MDTTAPENVGAEVKKLLAEAPKTYDPKKLGLVAMEAVKEQVIARMKMCGCVGKAFV